MPVRIQCPSCGRTLSADEKLLSKQVRCANCQEVFVARAAEDPIAEDGPPLLRPEPDHSGKATASLTLGVLGLFGWFLPIIGLPMTIMGLILGIKGRNSTNQGAATAGIVLNIIGLVLSIINAATALIWARQANIRF